MFLTFLLVTSALFQTARLMVADKQFPEVGVLEHSLKASQTLLQYFFPMNHKKQVARAPILLAETKVIKGGNHGLTCPGGSFPVISRGLPFNLHNL